MGTSLGLKLGGKRENGYLGDNAIYKKEIIVRLPLFCGPARIFIYLSTHLNDQTKLYIYIKGGYHIIDKMILYG